MNRRLIMGTMVVAASLLASEAMYAAPAAIHSPVNAMFSRVKMVSFSLLNDSKTPIKVKAGATEMTLEPGKAVPMKLAVGEKVIAQESTPNYPAGSVLTVVSVQLSDSTLELH